MKRAYDTKEGQKAHDYDHAAANLANAWLADEGKKLIRHRAQRQQHRQRTNAECRYQRISASPRNGLAVASDHTSVAQTSRQGSQPQGSPSTNA